MPALSRMAAAKGPSTHMMASSRPGAQVADTLERMVLSWPVFASLTVNVRPRAETVTPRRVLESAMVLETRLPQGPRGAGSCMQPGPHCVAPV